jgi:hypothetical protein
MVNPDFMIRPSSEEWGCLQEVLQEREAATSTSHRDIDVDDLLDDPELERLHAERLAALQKEAEKRATLQRKGHGELQEVTKCPDSNVCLHKDLSQCLVIFHHNYLAKDHSHTLMLCSAHCMRTY